MAVASSSKHAEKLNAWQTCHVEIDRQSPAFNSSMQSACLPHSSTEPTSNVSSCPPGGAISGMRPTVDAVMVHPIRAYWYYVLVGGGALLLLIGVTVMMILCCQRHHWMSRKTSSGHHHHHHPQHSVMYHNNQPANQQVPESYYLSQNPSCNIFRSTNQNHLYPGTDSSPEPKLIITLEKDDCYGSRCWNDRTAVSRAALTGRHVRMKS